MRVWSSITRTLFGVSRDRRGGVATFLAATVIPLVAFVGLAVDTGRGYLMKTRLNYALDAAALAGGRVMFDAAARDAAVDKFFNANFPTGYMGATITGPIATINTIDQTLKLDATANMDTSLMTVLGVDDMNVAASTEVQRQIKGMELALVLDITGSMRNTAPGSSQSKLLDLKDAATKLVDVLYAGRDEIDDFYMAVVPYTASVNIGTAHIGWLITPADTQTPGEDPLGYDPVSAYVASDYNPTTWKGCVEARHTGSRDRNDDPPSVEKFYPHFWPSDIGYSPSNERKNPWNTSNINEINDENGLGPNLNCGEPIVPLVKPRATIDTAIAGLDWWRFGGTMGSQGISWGWRAISPRWRGLWVGAEDSDLPKDYFDDLLAAGEPLSDKAIIVMTDGQNNIVYDSGALDDGHYTSYGKPDWNRLGTTSNNGIKGEINDRMLETCALMKAEDIIIYTITFDTEGSSNQAIRDTYEDCATTPSHYFNSPGEEELTAAFVAIGTQLSNLRLAK
ncbi:MAG: pilus assembly protein TadG-related protein [Pseudomonadota bacterium]